MEMKNAFTEFIPPKGGTTILGGNCTIQTGTIRAEEIEPSIQESINAEVRISLEEKTGERTYRRNIEASDSRAALAGLAALIVEYANMVGLDVMKVLSRLAVGFAAPVLREGKGENDEK